MIDREIAAINKSAEVMAKRLGRRFVPDQSKVAAFRAYLKGRSNG